MIKLATVSPCYNEEEVLEKSVERLTHLFKEMIAAEKISPDSKIVFVNDGSRDHTWDIICKLQKQNPSCAASILPTTSVTSMLSWPA